MDQKDTLNDDLPPNDPLDEAEFEELDERLLDAGLPETAMDVSMLDGFVVALQAGPVPVAPARWLPWVWDARWGREAPSFRSDADERRVVELVMRHADSAAWLLAEAPEEFEPILAEHEIGEDRHVAVAEDWCRGFLLGVKLEDGLWDNLRTTHPEWLRAIEAVVEAAERDPSEPNTPEALAAHDERIAAIAPAVRAIREHFRVHRAAQPGETTLRLAPRRPVKAEAKVGRNDPCPCGSGRKFKACHGR